MMISVEITLEWRHLFCKTIRARLGVPSKTIKQVYNERDPFWRTKCSSKNLKSITYKLICKIYSKYTQSCSRFWYFSQIYFDYAATPYARFPLKTVSTNNKITDIEAISDHLSKTSLLLSSMKHLLNIKNSFTPFINDWTSVKILMFILVLFVYYKNLKFSASFDGSLLSSQYVDMVPLPCKIKTNQAQESLC